MPVQKHFAELSPCSVGGSDDRHLDGCSLLDVPLNDGGLVRRTLEYCRLLLGIRYYYNYFFRYRAGLRNGMCGGTSYSPSGARDLEKISRQGLRPMFVMYEWPRRASQFRHGKCFTLPILAARARWG